VGIALEAAHVVAAHAFLAGDGACRAFGGVQAHVLLGCFFFSRQLVDLALGQAHDKFTMPTFPANAAEGIVTLFADGNSFSNGRKVPLFS
jgi:hypothetical protein